MLPLRQSTASQSVLIGPFVDDTDGATEETGLTIANTDIRLSANGGNMAAKNSGGGTHDEIGYYTITLDATDTATVGRLQLSVSVTGALPVSHEYVVLEEAVYDALYAASAAGFDPDGSELTAIPWNANWDAEVQSEVTDALNAYDPPTAAELVSEINDVQTDIAALSIPSAADVADAVWDEAQADHTTADTFGALATEIATIDGIVDQILVDSNELQGDWTDGGRLDLLIDAILADTDELQMDDIPTLISNLNDLSAAAVNAEVVDALATDTYVELGAAPAATASLSTKITWLYMLARNRITQTATTAAVRNDADSANVATAGVADDGTTFDRDEWT